MNEPPTIRDLCHRVAIRLESDSMDRHGLLEAATILVFVARALRDVEWEDTCGHGFDAPDAFDSMSRLDEQLQWIEGNRDRASNAEIRERIDFALRCANDVLRGAG